MSVDIYGRHWDYPDNELCSTCGQPDSCGDCNHVMLSNADVELIIFGPIEDRKGLDCE